MLEQMDGVIRHRLLINYRADPSVIAPLLPPGFRPQLVSGQAVVGVCVLRLASLRPHGLPACCGLASDNAAHRIAVEWDGASGTEPGVYVLRRDSAQRLPVLLGGRAFPGIHGPATFEVRDRADGIDVEMRTPDGTFVRASTAPTDSWSSALFPTAAHASRFFEQGRCGWSSGRAGHLEGLEMASCSWSADPVRVAGGSSFWEDTARFPSGSVALDASLLMRDLDVTWKRVWHARGCDAGASQERRDLGPAGVLG